MDVPTPSPPPIEVLDNDSDSNLPSGPFDSQEKRSRDAIFVRSVYSPLLANHLFILTNTGVTKSQARHSGTIKFFCQATKM